MTDPYQELQREYVEKLRAVTPGILQWWNARCPYPATEPVPADAMTDFHRRWPAGPVGHPRIIAVFRQYFFAVEDLNQRTVGELGEPSDDETEVWGTDVEPEARQQVRPIDLLINDLASVAPDLFQIMQGLVFVPMGVDPDGEMS